MKPINSFESYIGLEPILPINKSNKLNNNLGEAALRHSNLSKPNNDNCNFDQIFKNCIEDIQEK